MDKMIRTSVTWAPLLAAAVSAAMLAIAHGFETFGGLAPCTLCLKQREVYWAALAVGLAATLATRLSRSAALQQVALIVLSLIFVYGAGLAAYHAGAEWKWWPGPTTCAGGGGSVTASSLSALLNGSKVRPPRCDEAAWVWLGLSMAGWNVLASLGFSGFSAYAAARSKD